MTGRPSTEQLRFRDQIRENSRRRAEYGGIAIKAALLALGMFAACSLFYAARAETVDGRWVVIIDGDTIDVQGERIRILNIDAPESFRSRCEAELKLALRTKERLGQLLRSGSVEIRREGQDRYRRTLATLSVREGDVGQILVRDRLALPWKDGREDKERRLKVWCGPWATLP
ncbi:endonuclease YncB(thermonuclease family) [Microvirga lupini]|uniref:Endonuclease YncB(Thermonuclease family) n=1 Tax=Microvirga lupini TaxID=420324 RepID=A0A7W4VNY0_9HYPH|nr:thermonuclease family protein [Microvirga lupini]MBB3020622.1 endonuclease YncB(thermonuclease family) [Microvirga lupini]